MSDTRLTFEGLEAFRTALRQLPDTLKAEANAIVLQTADQAQREIGDGYPSRSGRLKSGVRVSSSQAGRFGVAATVASRARHASIFERGTGQRATRRGANRGRMLAANPAQAMIPKVVRLRRKMTDQLIELVRRAGFEVRA